MSSAEVPQPDKDKYLTQPEREQLQRLLSQPEEFPRELGSWITDYVGTNAFLQKSQVQGLPLLNTQVQTALDQLETLVEQVAAAQVTVDVDTVLTSHTTPTSVYSDLPTAGPSLTGLLDGTYLIIVSFVGHTASDGYQAIMSVSVNGASASDSNAAVVSTTTASSGFSMFSVSVSNSDNNSFVAKYKSSNGVIDATYSNRRLAALRIGA